MTLVDKKTLEIGELLLDVIPGDDYIQVRLGNYSTRIKFIDLWGAVFAIAGPEEQEKMMPVRQTEMQTFTRIIRHQLGRNMKKGQILAIPYEISVPIAVVDGLRGNMLNEKSKFRPNAGIPLIGKK